MNLAQAAMKSIVHLLSLVALILAEGFSAGQINDMTKDDQPTKKKTDCSKQLQTLEAKLLAKIKSLETK